MRRLVLVMALLVSVVTSAVGHSGGNTAIIATDPPQPAPGQSVQLKVEIFDPYMVPVEGGQVRAAIGLDGEALPAMVSLQGSAQGVYEGTVKVPAAGLAVISVEADLTDGPWRGAFPVRIGPDGGEIAELTLQMVPVEPGAGGAPSSTPVRAGRAGWWLPLIAGGAVILLLSARILRRRKRN